MQKKHTQKARKECEGKFNNRKKEKKIIIRKSKKERKKTTNKPTHSSLGLPISFVWIKRVYIYYNLYIYIKKYIYIYVTYNMQCMFICE